MHELPRFFLRIALFEESKQFGVREVLGARGGVRHGVCVARDVRDIVAVAVSTTVTTGEPTEVGSGGPGGGRPFDEAGDGGSVVRERFESGIGEATEDAGTLGLAEDPSLLEVAVGDVAVAMSGGDQPVLDDLGERPSPDHRLAGRIEEDATHALLGGVAGTEELGPFGNDLRQVSRARTEVSGESRELLQMQAEVPVDGDPAFGIIERLLHDREKPDGAGHAERDESQLAEGPLPLADTDAVLGEKVIEEVGEERLAVRRQLERASDGVDDPPEDDFPGAPAAVALEGLLAGDGLVSVGLVRLGPGEHPIDAVQEVIPDADHALGRPLRRLDEVVYEDLGLGERLVEQVVADRDRDVG